MNTHQEPYQDQEITYRRRQLSGYVNTRAMAVNDNISYYPYQIERWCKSVLHSSAASSEVRVYASDIYGEYFVNPAAGLNPKMKYFMRKGIHDQQPYLYRDRETDGTYCIIVNKRYCRVNLTTEEFHKVKKIFDELYIPHSIQKY